jgi:3-oxoacid CoA-transferase subunit A
VNKVVPRIEDAIADVKDGASIAIPGFFTCGVPRSLLKAVIDKKVKNLTLYCGCGPLVGATDLLTELVKNKQLKKLVDSYGLSRSASKGMQDPFEQAVRRGEIELEVVPMGTLAERYRAGGAGIAAIYTPTGIGSVVEEKVITNIEKNQKPKETRMFNGKKYVLEEAITPDFSFIHAFVGDIEGNLRYAMTARNFNPVMAMAGKVTIAEVENLVEHGGVKPDDIHTPGVYVKRVVKVSRPKFTIGIN